MSDEEEEFNTDFEQLIKIVQKFGWSVAIPDIHEEDVLPGLIIGTDEYIETITDMIPDSHFKGDK